MSILPILKARVVIETLLRAEFVILRQKGSHVQLEHALKPGFRVTLPYHNYDLAPGTINSIIKQMGLTKNEFENLL